MGGLATLNDVIMGQELAANGLITDAVQAAVELPGQQVGHCRLAGRLYPGH
jgi:hypothetical protein